MSTLWRIRSGWLLLGTALAGFGCHAPSERVATSASLPNARHLVISTGINWPYLREMYIPTCTYDNPVEKLRAQCTCLERGFGLNCEGFLRLPVKSHTFAPGAAWKLIVDVEDSFRATFLVELCGEPNTPILTDFGHGVRFEPRRASWVPATIRYPTHIVLIPASGCIQHRVVVETAAQRAQLKQCIESANGCDVVATPLFTQLPGEDSSAAEMRLGL